MEFTSKEFTLDRLQNQIKDNSKRIMFYKNWTPILMFLFVVLSFLMFYSNLEKIFVSVQSLFIGLLVLIFLTLTLFRFYILKKKKENRSLDTKIYNLLRL